MQTLSVRAAMGKRRGNGREGMLALKLAVGVYEPPDAAHLVSDSKEVLAFTRRVHRRAARRSAERARSRRNSWRTREWRRPKRRRSLPAASVHASGTAPPPAEPGR